jgi:hypothetical protein
MYVLCGLYKNLAQTLSDFKELNPIIISINYKLYKHIKTAFHSIVYDKN